MYLFIIILSVVHFLINIHLIIYVYLFIYLFWFLSIYNVSIRNAAKFMFAGLKIFHLIQV